MGSFLNLLRNSIGGIRRQREAGATDPFLAAFNDTESARAGAPNIAFGQGAQDPVGLNRIMQGATSPGGIEALLAPAYEGLKAIEQNTPIKALTGVTRGINRMIGSNVISEPDETTSPASLRNAILPAVGAVGRTTGIMDLLSRTPWARQGRR